MAPAASDSIADFLEDRQGLSQMSFRGLQISLRALDHPEEQKEDCLTQSLADVAHRRQRFLQSERAAA